MMMRKNFLVRLLLMGLGAGLFAIFIFGESGMAARSDVKSDSKQPVNFDFNNKNIDFMSGIKEQLQEQIGKAIKQKLNIPEAIDLASPESEKILQNLGLKRENFLPKTEDLNDIFINFTYKTYNSLFHFDGAMDLEPEDVNEGIVVVDYDTASFASEKEAENVDANGPWLLLFTADWCEPCKEFFPDYANFAAVILKNKYPELKLAVVNCSSANKESFNEITDLSTLQMLPLFQVNDYPSIRLIDADHRKAWIYSGKRSDFVTLKAFIDGLVSKNEFEKLKFLADEHPQSIRLRNLKLEHIDKNELLRIRSELSLFQKLLLSIQTASPFHLRLMMAMVMGIILMAGTMFCCYCFCLSSDAEFEADLKEQLQRVGNGINLAHNTHPQESKKNK